jgi:hypothetical protein
VEPKRFLKVAVAFVSTGCYSMVHGELQQLSYIAYCAWFLDRNASPLSHRPLDTVIMLACGKVKQDGKSIFTFCVSSGVTRSEKPVAHPKTRKVLHIRPLNQASQVTKLWRKGSQDLRRLI